MLRFVAMTLAVAAVGGSAAAQPIVFSADRSSQLSGEIYRMSLDGARLDLSNSAAQDTDPVVSPNGQEVAFFSDRTGRQSLYVVGIDGLGLTRISGPLPQTRVPALVGWLRDDRHVLVVTYAGLDSYAPGEKPQLIVRGDVADAAPSPDGRFVAVRVGSDVRVITPTGKRAFAVSALSDSVRFLWSSRSRLAVYGDGTARVVSEQGHILARFPAADASWSPNGRLLAAMSGGILEVRGGDGSGRVVLRKRLFPASLVQKIVKSFGTYTPNLVWAGNTRVLVGNVELGSEVVGENPSPYANAEAAVAVPSGTTSSPSQSTWYAGSCGCSSPDGALVARTAGTGDTFTLSVSAPAGAGARTLALIPGCWEDGVLEAGAQGIQFAGDGAVVYQTNCVTPPADVYTLTGGRLTRLTHNVQGTDTEPALSPDGTRIAFVQAGAPDSCRGCASTLWVMNADGTNPRQLTTNDGQDDSWDRSPSWSPDGTTIVYSHSTIDSFGRLVIVNSNGGSPVSLDVDGTEPAWGPTRIAYIGNANVGGAHLTLRTIAPDGTDMQVLATGVLGTPTWSPSGELAALDLTTGKPQALEASAGKTTRVPLPFAAVEALRWAPDGSRLLAVARAQAFGPFDLYSVRPDGTDPQRLTTNLDALGPSR